MAYKFFTEPAFDFEVQCLNGNVHYGCGDVGEVLATVESITDGDDESWVTAWRALADRVAGIARGASAGGHRISARNAYLRAAVYYATAMSAVDGVSDAEQVLAGLFTAHRQSFGEHVRLLDTPAERVEIPYEGTTLPGYFFSSAADGAARPTIILVNGSDGAVTALWPPPAAGAGPWRGPRR